MTLLGELDRWCGVVRELARIEAGGMDCGCPHCFRLANDARTLRTHIRAALLRQGVPEEALK